MYTALYYSKFSIYSIHFNLKWISFSYLEDNFSASTIPGTKIKWIKRGEVLLAVKLCKVMHSIRRNEALNENLHKILHLQCVSHVKPYLYNHKSDV